MSGHGHVQPNPDGTKARCGGPVICDVCAHEYFEVHGRTPDRGDVHPDALADGSIPDGQKPGHLVYVEDAAAAQRRHIALGIALNAAAGQRVEADALIAEAKKIDAYLRGKED